MSMHHRWTAIVAAVAALAGCVNLDNPTLTSGTLAGRYFLSLDAAHPNGWPIQLDSVHALLGGQLMAVDTATLLDIRSYGAGGAANHVVRIDTATVTYQYLGGNAFAIRYPSWTDTATYEVTTINGNQHAVLAIQAHLPEGASTSIIELDYVQ